MALWFAVVAGVVVCLGLDALHVWSGTTFYARPVLFGLAWWPPLLFSAASAVVLTGSTAIRRAAGEAPLPHPPGLVLGDGVAFVVAYGCTSFLGRASVPLAVTLTLFWLARAAGLRPYVAISCVLTAIGGSAVEMGLSATGVFGYHHPDVLGIPWWLPAIYLHAGVLGARLDGVVARA